jgi:hypothetical protein
MQLFYIPLTGREKFFLSALVTSSLLGKGSHLLTPHKFHNTASISL